MILRETSSIQNSEFNELDRKRDGQREARSDKRGWWFRMIMGGGELVWESNLSLFIQQPFNSPLSM